MFYVMLNILNFYRGARITEIGSNEIIIIYFPRF